MRLLLISVLLCFFFSIQAQQSTGNSVTNLAKTSNVVHYSKGNSSVPNYIKVNEDVPVQKFDAWIHSSLKMSKEFTLDNFRQGKDALGYTHARYQQNYNGIPIEGHVYIVHSNEKKIVSMNGTLVNSLGKINLQPAVSEKAALTLALKHVGAKKYRWEEKKKSGSSLSTEYPKGSKIIIETKAGSKNYRLTYKFDIYASAPLSRDYIYVDAISGEVLNVVNRICHIGGSTHVHDANLEDEEIEHDVNTIDASGTAATRYSGNQSITADEFSGGYRLRESVRNIETYDMNTGTEYTSAVDFVSSDNQWRETANLDNAAYDAHWGAEVTYDYYLGTFNRNGIDDAGTTMKSYIHYGDDYDNAFWDGERMTYGDGSNASGGFTPLPALDVVGHEFTHGVTEYTAGLIYAGESGALNEAFSDIFGTIIEFEGKPGSANYELGEDVMYSGGALRSLSNPNLYQNPDTYEGDYWDPSEEVHTNSGVADFWFYLLAEGGNGTNDIGNSYSVSGLGMDKAGAIAYRTLSVYLTPASDYAAARYYSIKSAIDLYGSCTPEVEAVTNGWYAVGVGAVYSPVVVADFVASDTVYCSIPASVNFTNLSSNSSDFVWNFGDASVSSVDENPVHTYSNFGTYSVTLTADGGTCGTDVITKTSYITVSSTATCITRVPTTGFGSLQTACDGTIFDDGGPTTDYSNSTSGIMTIQPTDANSVLLTFDSFDYENGYDYLYIYDGASVSSPLIGSYTGSNLPEAGSIIASSGGAITIQQSSDGSVTGDGFGASWSCLNANSGPLVDFDAEPTRTCDGVVQFIDKSVNLPISWSWNFGDGTTSMSQNPLKTYATNGVYDVTLEVCNSNSCDAISMGSLITVDIGGQCDIIIPTSGVGAVQTACSGVIKDDGGNDDYNNSSSGYVTISPTGATSVTLTFNSFDMENDYDYLYVYDGADLNSPLIGTFTGNTLPNGGTVTSSGGSITLQQITDRYVVGTGFDASWLCSTGTGGGDGSVSLPSSGPGVVQTECSGTLKDNGGDFNYSHNSDGSISISPAGATSVTLSFSSFDFENNYDFLYVYDGPSTSSTLLGTYTGTTIPNDITSTVGSITIRQYTDGSAARAGFECTWLCSTVGGPSVELIPSSGTGVVLVECSGVLKDDGGDGNYSSNSDGSITISPTGASSVTLSFSSFNFENNSDYLYVYDGPSTSSTLLETYTGATIPHAIISTGGSITLRQETDGSIESSGFQASWFCTVEEEYVIIPSSGTGDIQTECTGVLKDDGEDGDYSSNSDGSITISPTGASSVTLSFSSFHFENGFDDLHVYDGSSVSSTLLESFTGSTTPSDITSTGGSITIRQETDGSIQFSGFRASWACLIPVGIVDGANEFGTSVYPNPAGDLVTVDLGSVGNDDVPVSLTDVLQTTLIEKVMTQNNSTIDVSELPAGLYFINIDNKAVHKLIVK